MKHFADHHRTEREFNVGDLVYLGLQPYRQSIVSLRRNFKLAPRFYGPFPVVAKVGKVAYRLALPSESLIHPTFHVSLLKKTVGRNNVVIPQLPLTSSDGQLMVEPIAILDRRLVKRNNSPVAQVRVQWSNRLEEDATWEDWSVLQSHFPEFCS